MQAAATLTHSNNVNSNIIKNLDFPTFQEIAIFWLNEEYIKHAPRSGDDTFSLIQSKVFPIIGEKLINEIGHQDIINIAMTHAPTAPARTKRAVQITNRIFVYARDIFNYDITNPVRDGVKLLYKNAANSEYPYLELSEIPDFFRKVEQVKTKKAQTKIAFWLIAYTALRRKEIMLANWQEIDFEKKTWSIPNSRMKMGGKDHTIPISKQIIDLLYDLQNTTDRDTGSLFDINPAAPLNLCTAAGYKNRMCLHGLRKTFSTHANESRLWQPDAIEIQLAHKIKGVRGVYNKAQYFQERTEMMSWYADEIDHWRKVKK